MGTTNTNPIIEAVALAIEYELDEKGIGNTLYTGHNLHEVKYDEDNKRYYFTRLFATYNSEGDRRLQDVLKKWKERSPHFNFYLVRHYNIFEITFHVKRVQWGDD